LAQESLISGSIFQSLYGEALQGHSALNITTYALYLH